MEYLIGWGLLLDVVLLIWLVIHYAGGEREEMKPHCSVDGGADRTHRAHSG